MRRLFAALIVVTVVFSLVGCGGGGDDPAADQAAVEDGEAAPEPPTPPADSGEAEEGFSPQVSGFPRPFPTNPLVLPDEIKQRLDTNQPMLILFYDAEHQSTDDMQESVDAVMEKYRGLIDLVEYALAADFESIDEDGQITEELSGDRRSYLLADELGIGTTPFIVLVDREGTITWMGRGYIDPETLELKVIYATQ